MSRTDEVALLAQPAAVVPAVSHDTALRQAQAAGSTLRHMTTPTSAPVSDAPADFGRTTVLKWSPLTDSARLSSTAEVRGSVCAWG